MLPLCSSERSWSPCFDEGRASRRRKAGTATIEVCSMWPEDSAGTTEQAAQPSSVALPTYSSSSAWYQQLIVWVLYCTHRVTCSLFVHLQSELSAAPVEDGRNDVTHSRKTSAEWVLESWSSCHPSTWKTALYREMNIYGYMLFSLLPDIKHLSV